MSQSTRSLPPFPLPPETEDLLNAAPSVAFATSEAELVELSVRDAVNGWREVAYDVPGDFSPKAIIYVAPPFRHTHFDGRQVVVHNRLEDRHKLFSYNLYPGPSAKKGIYGVLPEGRKIIEACLSDASVEDYETLLDLPTLETD